MGPVRIWGSCLIWVIACLPVAARYQHGPSASDVERLRQIGLTLAQAVSKQDVETLLTFDRPDLRSSDRVSIHDRTSDLYCYLFVRACNLGRPSVSDIITGARHLRVDVQTIEPADQDPPTAILLFYDGVAVSQKELSNPESWCELSARGELVSWTFVLEHGQWVSANPIFDSETDTLCNPK